MIKYLHLILSLIAGILVGVVSIQMNNDMNTFFFKLFTTLIVFYLIGLGVRKMMLNIIETTDDKIIEDTNKEDILEVVEDEAN